jgi:dolichol-phosphate mannosyltransferase
MPTTPCGIAILGFDGDYMVELSIIVPTYNESKNVAALVAMLDDALTGIAWEVVFVDDDSPDGTSQLVRGLAQNDSRVRLIQRIGRKGLSRAVIEGMLSTSAAFIAVMDADHQHDERILPVMLQRLKDKNFDVVVGSRYIQGGSVGKWDETRQRISKTATRLGQILVGKELSDPMSGFFVLRR